MGHWYKIRNQVLALVAMLSAMAGPASRPGSAQDTAEEDVWRRAQMSGSVEAYETYLRQFPLGKHTREAYRCAVTAARSCVIEPGAGPASGDVQPVSEGPASSSPLGRVY